jgi:hypothetical protein
MLSPITLGLAETDTQEVLVRAADTAHHPDQIFIGKIRALGIGWDDHPHPQNL